MTTKQVKQALTRDRERKQAERAERIVVPEYPATHNPYLAHWPMPDCYPGCKLLHHDGNVDPGTTRWDS